MHAPSAASSLSRQGSRTWVPPCPRIEGDDVDPTPSAQSLLWVLTIGFESDGEARGELHDRIRTEFNRGPASQLSFEAFDRPAVPARHRCGDLRQPLAPRHAWRCSGRGPPRDRVPKSARGPLPHGGSELRPHLDVRVRQPSHHEDDSPRSGCGALGARSGNRLLHPSPTRIRLRAFECSVTGKCLGRSMPKAVDPDRIGGRDHRGGILPM